MYVPTAKRAYVRDDSSNFISNVFHEYFGHGLYCEHSLIGQPLCTMNPDEGQHYMYEPQQQGIAPHHIANYEGFATWLEDILCTETGYGNIWKKKKEGLPVFYQQVHELFCQAEESLTRFGLMAQLQFPKYYTASDLVPVVKKLYRDSFSNIDMVLLYGSKKPYSDIDLFVVSDKPSRNYFNGWLDVYELNREEFNYLTKNFDISVTEPLLKGELVYGSQSQLKLAKRQLCTQVITTDAIGHNRKMAEEQAKFAAMCTDERLKKIGESYAKSYGQVASKLESGVPKDTIYK